MIDKNNLMVRTLAGLVYVLVIIVCLLWNWLSFGILFALITGFTIWEFATIVNKSQGTHVNRFICSISGAYLFLAVFTFTRQLSGSEIFIPYLLSIIYLFISELYTKDPKTLYNWSFAMMSQLYIALPFSTLCALSFVNVNSEYITNVYYSPLYTLSIFLFLWASDSGAYCIGSMFGKHRLFPSISPKKSWEGVFGGAALALIVSQIMAYEANNVFNDHSVLLNALGWAGLSIVVVVFGCLGDLVESLLKRRLGIKDSGNVIPGHGGFLDRFDSALMAMPASLLYIYVITGIV